MQNTNRTTACLPKAKAAGDPMSWGIITSKFPEIAKNKTVACKQVPQPRQKIRDLESDGGMEEALSKQDCISRHGKVGQIVEGCVEDQNLANRERFLPRYKKIKENIPDHSCMEV